ncbi:MAG TPA: valine--tRNA ligase [Chitinophagaceae bacterium]|nr:valine--tRNA ligase [Chitinophagaceae bacterium]
MSKNFEHQQAEEKWYSHWIEKNYFHSEPDSREPYTIVIPPPNVTGVLHMGHCLNNTIQDILIRRERMRGKNACWVPGTDHASIATEAKVVGMLREKGIAKSSLTREAFLEYAWEWKEKYGGIILTQLRKLGCSCDWERTAFTMDDDYYKSVIEVFIKLYDKGWIYRGKRMINWDVKAQTALSDEEVIYKELQSKLYFIKYAIAGNDASSNSTSAAAEFITIATVRPETILGDTAICVNPGDERYKHLHGKYALVPLINRRIPIIADDYVEMDFGTGALKVTPAHDMNDYQLGQKYNLEVIDTMNDDGTMSDAAQLYIGEDRFAVRGKIVHDLEAAGQIVKIEDYTNQVGFSERNPDTVVEPRLSMQWWISMKKLSEPALNAVVDGEINFHPAKFKNTYKYWMENIRDWCISRQLWWGHRIPAWYLPDGSFVVAATREEAWEKFSEKLKVKSEATERPATGTTEITPGGTGASLTTHDTRFTIEDLKQDEDVLDTWASSWLWPFEVFKGLSNPGNADIKYYYPTNTLVTAPEIIFFWVARMIMAGFEFMGQKPFSDVYFTGIVRDKIGRKMSKSLGNSPDLLALIDKYGADAVRFGIMFSSPAGNDLMFDEASLEQGRNFNNKLWNALKLVKMWAERQATNQEDGNAAGNFAITWFENRLNEVRAEVDSLMQQFKLSEALQAIRALIWDDFCSWYLEWVKPGFEQPIESNVFHKTVIYFDELLGLLHPFMPFITEDIYHRLRQRNDDLCIKQYAPAGAANATMLAGAELLKKVITSLRDARARNQIKPKETIALHIETANTASYTAIEAILAKQVNASAIQFVQEAVAGTIIVAVEKDKFYIETEKAFDTSNLKEELLKDLAYQNNFLQSVLKKLGNERFVQNAKPEVVAMERKKQADAEARIKTIQESLVNL